MLAKKGLSVLLWDMDPQGGSSYFFNLENSNNNTYSRMFDGYCNIYDLIHHTQNSRIDIITNDGKFTDQFMLKASRVTDLNFVNSDLIKATLSKVEDDYDICLIDCPPGRFLLHDNIFKATDLLLIPNIPAPLSVYCNNMLIDELQAKWIEKDKILSFYNMVQAHKTTHKYFLNNINPRHNYSLRNYIPFYAEIEAITLSKESIFQHMKEYKTNIYYDKLWQEVCIRMQWNESLSNKSIVVNLHSVTNKTIQPEINIQQKRI